MGNEQSQLQGIEIEEKAVEVSDFWSQHNATICNSDNETKLSIFIGELFVSGPLWKTQTPLEKYSKNLMIYRHPCIVKYISSWQKNSKYHLAIEEVKPLSQVLPTLNNLQICIGLHSILKAICFLHEKALVSHNNVCITTIYVTKDGSWKLGGMEYICKFSELTTDYLSKSRSNRYSRAVDINEDKNITSIQCNRKDIIDVFAFGVLVNEILKNNNSDEVPALQSFRDICKNDLQNSNISQRPKLSKLLEHEFFNHKFIAIRSFLTELPLKSDEEKSHFFSTLIEKLKMFNEVTVASQLSGLLLSRMVLLNKTAHNDVLPFVLTPRQGNEDQSRGLFTFDTFKTYLSPKLLEIFSVRDAQIRLLLLNNFVHFMQTFTKDELENCILPELLLGIKDTNDHLVAVTLRTLADLVSLLGATTVIGGRRAKLFNDGIPISHPGRKMSRVKKLSERNNSIANDTDQLSLSNSSIVAVSLFERPRPDGEEGESSTESVNPSNEEDLDNWEDWDVNENQNSLQQLIPLNSDVENIEISSGDPQNLEPTSQSEENITIPTIPSEAILPDILELDIKRRSSKNSEDFDFFGDMEPVIESTNKYVIDSDKIVENGSLSSKLVAADHGNEEGWGEDEWGE